MNLGGFIDTFKEAIAKRVVESYPPLYRPSENGGTLPRLLRKPLGAQADAIRGAALSLKAHRGTTVVGEMGTGKTFIGAAAAHMAGFERILIICPPHLVPKWKREVEMTVPGVRAAIVESITDLERLRLSVGPGPLFAVMSREKAKLSYRWMPAVIRAVGRLEGKAPAGGGNGGALPGPLLPRLHGADRRQGRRAADVRGPEPPQAHLRRPAAAPLWQADRSGPARYPLADYIKHRMKGFFDLLIGDEVHEFKGRGSSPGHRRRHPRRRVRQVPQPDRDALGRLLLDHLPSPLPVLPGDQDGVRALGRAPLDQAVRLRGGHRRQARRRRHRGWAQQPPSQLPQGYQGEAGPRAQRSVPHHREHGIPAPRRRCLRPAGLRGEDPRVLYGLGGGRDRVLPAQRPTSTVFEDAEERAGEAALKSGSKRLLATYLQTLLAYPDGCTRGETVFDPRTGDVIVQVPPLSEEKLYPKEKALIDLVAAERLEGRRVLVYVTHTGTRDITGRMDDILTRHGIRVAVMKADAVAPNRREKWVADKVKEGIDVLICHPRLVQTGLDLIDFPTICWDETDYSVYVVRQASRRSWRIGQTRPVKVVFMSYRNTLQADALKLVAKKMQSSLAVEGELPEDGLAAYGDDGDDMMMALARRIVSGDEEDTETMEEVFAQARNAESEAEELLVDDGWKVVEVEPETISVNGNGHHDDLFGPTVELVPVNGRHANGNGHHDEADEPQQTLFSWAEFMAEEPVKPKGRGRKPQPASLSMFEWALTVEQEREKEPVGAGR